MDGCAAKNSTASSTLIASTSPTDLPAHLHRERLGIEARAPARLAQHLHVRQEAHLDGLDALALARVAAPGIRAALPRPLPFAFPPPALKENRLAV